MRRLPRLLASGAAAVACLTAATAPARQFVVPVDEPVVGRTKAPENAAAALARRRSLRDMANQLRPFYRYELMHARTACRLTKEQLQAIRPEADTAYERAIDGLYADNLEASRSPGGEEPDYRPAIHEAVFFVVARHARPDQMAAYKADLERRAASRKEAGVPLLVAVIDRQLLLTARQREEIAESLSAHWDDRWCDGLEAAFTMGSRWPAVPDELVVPHLNATQQETWRQVPRVHGRLWGVVIDHGGDPAMEQELGAKVDARPTPRPGDAVEAPVARAVRQPLIVRPQPAVRDVVVLREPVAQRVVIQANPARLVAPANRPAAPAQEDDPEAQEDQAERLRQQQLERQKLLEQRYRSVFDRQVFGNPYDEAATRAQLESALAKRVDELGRAGGLIEAQAKKLRAAGRGDIKRFFDDVAEARKEFVAALAPQGGRPRIILNNTAPLRAARAALEKVDGPIFANAVERTLNADQVAAIEKDARDRLAFRHRADIRWTSVLLARSLGLVDDQRRRLESVLLERALPPNQFDAHDYFDYAIVMYQASRIAEKDLRPIFDDLQWRVLQQEFDAARQWDLYIRRGGFFEERIHDIRDAPLPPIHLLEPARIRSR